MGERSYLLYALEEALKARGVHCDRLDSVPAVRSILPGYEGALTNDRLSELIEKVRSGSSLELLLSAKPKGKVQERKSKLTKKEMTLRYIKGYSIRSIASDAGVTTSRVYALIDCAKKIDLLRQKGFSEETLIRSFCD
jgi:hypothetical protein